MTTLTKASQNRIAKVQKAARAAKEVWEALKIKGDQLADAKRELENLEPEGALTPDDLIKVKAGHGNVADAKNLGYLKKRKSRQRSKNVKESLQDRRSKSKKMNSSLNNYNSNVMKEKIFNMEQERNNLMRQADMLKKRDDSIENLMDKYIPKSGKKSRPQNRSNLMNKIKERMNNLEKGKSIEIIESKKARELRMNRERKEDSVDNEGGENEPKPEDENPDEQSDEGEGDALFQEEDGGAGDEMVNRPGDLGGPIPKVEPSARKTQQKAIGKFDRGNVN